MAFNNNNQNRAPLKRIAGLWISKPEAKSKLDGKLEMGGRTFKIWLYPNKYKEEQENGPDFNLVMGDEIQTKGQPAEPPPSADPFGGDDIPF